MSNIFFLAESVSLESKQLTQRGINLDKDRKEFLYDGAYTADKHFAWIEHRRLRCQQRGWLARNIIDYGCDMKISFFINLSFPPELMGIIRKLTDAPTGKPSDELIIDEEKASLIYPEIQVPIISWLHNNELIRISARLKELYPNKNNPDGKTLWEHANLCREVIEGWFIRNNQEIPKIEYPGVTLSKIDRCFDLFKKAATCGPQTAEQLVEWKQRFKEFKPVYVTRCAEKYVKIYGEDSVTMGTGSDNGLAWRRDVWPSPYSS